MEGKDKVVWITGASSGIGEALAYAYSRTGARLILSSRNEEKLLEIRGRCANPKDHVVLPLDLTDTGSLGAKVAAALEKTGRIDVLVSNAGVQNGLPIDRYTDEAREAGLSALSVSVIGGPLTMTFIALETTGDLWLTTAVLIAAIVSMQVTREFFGYSFATWRFHLRGEAIRSAVDIGWMRNLSVARMMRKMGNEMGEELPPEFDEVVDRLEWPRSRWTTARSPKYAACIKVSSGLGPTAAPATRARSASRKARNSPARHQSRPRSWVPIQRSDSLPARAVTGRLAREG